MGDLPGVRNPDSMPVVTTVLMIIIIIVAIMSSVFAVASPVMPVMSVPALVTVAVTRLHKITRLHKMMGREHESMAGMMRRMRPVVVTT